MSNTDKNTPMPQCDKNAVMPSFIYLVTNETDRTVESCFYNCEDAVREFEKMGESKTTKSIYGC